jgi:hypothetical protein
VNRGNFWIQSRPLLAYWGGPDRPARYLQARVLKDDYDFASALLYSVQVQNYLLGLVTFRNPGGDKHPSLDPIKDGKFPCSRLRLRFDLAGVPFNAPILVNGKDADPGTFAPGARIAVDLGGALLWLQSLGAKCGERSGAVTIAREDGLLTISIDLMNTREHRTIEWPQVAYCAFAMTIQHSDDVTPQALDQRLYHTPAMVGDTFAGAVWYTSVGVLRVDGATWVSEVQGLDRAFHASVNGRALPVVRLSTEPLFVESLAGR